MDLMAISTVFNAGQLVVLILGLNWYWKGHARMLERMTRVETKLDMLVKD